MWCKLAPKANFLAVRRMKNLRDQLLKSGLVSKADARRAQHEQLRERKEQGITHNEAQAIAEQRRQQAQAERAAAQRQRDREIEAERASQQRARELALRLHGIVAHAALPLRGGERRWHFVAADGAIRWVMVPEEIGRQLENGLAAVVEDPAPERHSPFRVVPRDAARRLVELDPASVRFWNGVVSTA
jgi:hypothetical protein